MASASPLAEQRRLAGVGGANHCSNLSRADEEGEPVQDGSRRTAVSKGDRVEEDVHSGVSRAPRPVRCDAARASRLARVVAAGLLVARRR